MSNVLGTYTQSQATTPTMSRAAPNKQCRVAPHLFWQPSCVWHTAHPSPVCSLQAGGRAVLHRQGHNNSYGGVSDIGAELLAAKLQEKCSAGQNPGLWLRRNFWKRDGMAGGSTQKPERKIIIKNCCSLCSSPIIGFVMVSAAIAGLPPSAACTTQVDQRC